MVSIVQIIWDIDLKSTIIWSHQGISGLSFLGAYLQPICWIWIPLFRRRSSQGWMWEYLTNDCGAACSSQLASFVAEFGIHSKLFALIVTVIIHYEQRHQTDALPPRYSLEKSRTRVLMNALRHLAHSAALRDHPLCPQRSASPHEFTSHARRNQRLSLPFQIYLLNLIYKTSCSWLHLSPLEDELLTPTAAWR
jgi:hypothetical protein